MPVLFAVATVVSVACGGDDGGVAGSSSDTSMPELTDVVTLEGGRVEVTALDNTFNPQNIRIEAGTTVVWENRGRQDHDVIAVTGDDGWGVSQEGFGPGDTYEYTFEESGTYRYYCSLHGDADAGMIGAVVVEEPGSAVEDQQADVRDNDSNNDSKEAGD